MTLRSIRKRAARTLDRLEKARYLGVKMSAAQRRQAATQGRVSHLKDGYKPNTSVPKGKAGRVLAQTARINTALERIAGLPSATRALRASSWEQRTSRGIQRRAGSYAPMRKRDEPADIGFTFTFAKSSVTGRYVWGWASVIEENGKPVLDSQGDLIAMDDTAEGKGLRSAAHHFVKSAREAKAMHAGDRIGDVVESVLIDDDFARAHGITHGKRGWWIGMEIADPAIQKRVASGEYRAFSIGGAGRRKALD